jgi:hypothetical protein
VQAAAGPHILDMIRPARYRFSGRILGTWGEATMVEAAGLRFVVRRQELNWFGRHIAGEVPLTLDTGTWGNHYRKHPGAPDQVSLSVCRLSDNTSSLRPASFDRLRAYPHQPTSTSVPNTKASRLQVSRKEWAAVRRAWSTTGRVSS